MTEKQSLKIGEGKPGPGRKKGVPNRTTTLLKDAILQAATEAGNGDMAAYLKEQATKNPAPFLALLGKVLPLQIAGTLALELATKEQRDAAVAAAQRANS
jgi:hypothetical protein